MWLSWTLILYDSWCFILLCPRFDHNYYAAVYSLRCQLATIIAHILFAIRIKWEFLIENSLYHQCTSSIVDCNQIWLRTKNKAIVCLQMLWNTFRNTVFLTIPFTGSLLLHPHSSLHTIPCYSGKEWFPKVQNHFVPWARNNQERSWGYDIDWKRWNR